MPHRIVRVDAGSVCARAGLLPGDMLLSINGRRLRDFIDYQAFTCATRLTLSIARGEARLEFSLRKGRYDPMGLGFDQPLMSCQRDCINHCLFCFVDQLPAHTRPTLRVKDDDWRMSLMMGNFVTLTNVSEQELDRIIARRCAPLYISIHATDPTLRARLLGQEKGAQGYAQLTKLAQAGLSFHTQAVLCPGLNDGPALDQTMRELLLLWPHARSLAVVPVGLTTHREGLYPIAPYDRAGAARVLEQIDAVREKCLAELGDPFVHPADEFYLLAGRDFPTDEAYGDYPQIENGVGLCRLLETQYRSAWRDADFSKVRPARVVLACGVSVAPFLQKLLDDMPIPGVDCEVRATENHFFGPTVTVSGLLTGSDLIRTLSGCAAERILICESMLREGEDVFLDDMPLTSVTRTLGVPIIKVSSGEALVNALSGLPVGG
ncbi:MAG: DUF512 domain-containing protein [Clostridia bacterium]